MRAVGAMMKAGLISIEFVREGTFVPPNHSMPAKKKFDKAAKLHCD